MSDFLPPPAIAAAIVSALGVLPVFSLLGLGVAALKAPWRRLWCSVFVSIALWLALAYGLGAFDVAGDALAADLLAGLAVVLSAAICAYLVVSLMAWGFTVSMALDLERRGGTLSLDGWLEAYGNDCGFQRFAHDRLALLESSGVAARDGDDFVLTPRGRWMTLLARILVFYFGIERSAPGTEREAAE